MTAAPLTLQVFRGNQLLRTEQFSREIIKIGRLASAHLSLDDEKVSRIHAVIEVTPASMSIIDMGSAEGTFLNGKRVSRGALHSGDEVALGGLRIVVGESPVPVIAAPEAAPAEAPVAEAPPAPAPVAAPVATAPARREAPARPAAPPPDATPPAEVAEPAPAVEAEAPEEGPPLAIRHLPAAPTEAGEPGVELRLLWGDTLLESGVHAQPAKPVTIGAEGADLPATGPDLPAPVFPVLRYRDGEYLFQFGKGMTGGLQRARGEASLSRLVKEKKAAPADGVDGAYAVALPPDGLAWMSLGSNLRVEAFHVRPEPVRSLPWWERINYAFLNLFLVFFFLGGAFVVTAVNFPSADVDTVGDDLFTSPQRMAKFILKPAAEQPRNPYLEKLQRTLKKEAPGEAAARHKGEEGQMGKKDAPRTSGRSAPRAIDPNAKEIVKNTGLVGLIGKGRGGGLSTIFGQGGLGGDLKGAVGNMFGPTVGDSYGVGGLGLKGTGTGGGGQAETIGIGGVGTKGRGGGLGGAGYGTGVGGLGRKGEREVSIQTGSAAVLGSIDKELVRRVIQEHASQIRYCYEQELQRDPRLEGKVVVRWIINADGRVSNPQIDAGGTTMASDPVHRCMMDRIQSWEFPKPKGGGIAVITYPWILRASGGAGG